MERGRMSPEEQDRVGAELRVALLKAVEDKARDMPLGSLMVVFGQAMAALAGGDKAQGGAVDYEQIWDGLRDYFITAASSHEAKVREMLEQMAEQRAN